MRQKGKHTLSMSKGFASIIILIIIIVAAGGFFGYQWARSHGYLGCVDSCTGTGQIQNIDIPAIISPAPSISPTPLPTGNLPITIAGWKTYTNKTYGYSIQYPPNLSMLDMSDTTIIDTKGVQCVELGIKGTPYDDWPTYIEVITDNDACYNDDTFMQNIKKEISTMKVGDSVDDNGATLRRKDNKNIDGNLASVFEIKNLALEKRVVIPYNNKLYVIGTYFDPTKPDTQFDQMLSTFKFTN